MLMVISPFMKKRILFSALYKLSLRNLLANSGVYICIIFTALCHLHEIPPKILTEIG